VESGRVAYHQHLVMNGVYVPSSLDRIQGSGFRAQGSGLRVQGQGSGFRVQG